VWPSSCPFHEAPNATLLPGCRDDRCQSEPSPWNLGKVFGTACACTFYVSNLFQGITPLSNALGFHIERHNVLTTNIAHVDTPGYRPMEMARSPGAGCQDFGRQLSESMTRTHSGHLPGGEVSGVKNGLVHESPDAIAGMDGNYVSLDTEAAKVAQNQLRYEVVTALASAQFRRLSYVASDGRG